MSNWGHSPYNWSYNPYSLTDNGFRTPSVMEGNHVCFFAARFPTKMGGLGPGGLDSWDPLMKWIVT